MTYRELTRKLRRLNCRFERQGRGDHEIWINLDSDATTSIPNWGSSDLRPGTLRAVLRQLGISRDEFERAYPLWPLALYPIFAVRYYFIIVIKFERYADLLTGCDN